MVNLSISEILLFLWLMAKIYNASSTEYKSFRCGNGKYILDKYVCNDIYEDCGDGSDEFNACDKKICGAGKFKCVKDGTCLNITAYCNTIKDCSDGSDEWNCGDEVETDDCQFSKGKFLCKDKLKCLDMEYTCDGDCNCFDCSDENNNCSKIVDNTCNACPRHCFSTPLGPRCFCDPRDNKLGNLCKKMEDCSSDPNYFCPQHCSRYNKKFTCSCFKNYKEVSDNDGAWCQSKESHGNLLIFTTPSRIKVLNLTSHKIDIIVNQVECATLAAAYNYVIYTKYRDDSRRLYNTSISTKITTEVLYWYAPITSVSVDYITNNFYFSTDTSVLACSRPNKNSCKRVICCDANFVALAPRSGIMFYTRRSPKGNKKYIFKSNMDGSDENIVIDGVFDDLASLTVDESAERLYWLEKQERKIHSLPISNGFNSRISSIDHEGDNSTSSITVFHKKVLFVKNQKNIITSMKNFQDFTLFYPDLSTLSIELLYAYNPYLQAIDRMGNPCARTSCPLDQEKICLLRSSSLNNLEFNCTRIEEED